MAMSLIESLTKIKNAVYGREVREAIHDGVFRANQIADNAVSTTNQTQIRQDNLEAYNDQMIQEMTDKDVISAPEVIEARDGEEKLADRLNRTDYQIARTVVTGLDDSATNNTLRIQSTYDKLTSGCELVIPVGVWKVHGVYFYKEDVKITMLGTLSPADTSTPFVVKLGVKDGVEKNTIKNMSGNIKVDSFSNWLEYPETVGVVMENTDNSVLKIWAAGFGINLELVADGKSCCYNQITVVGMINSKVGVKTTAVNGGWVNENTFIGGRYSHYSGIESYEGAVFLDIGNDHDRWEADNNRFINPSFEGGGMVARIKGNTNLIENARVEMRHDYSTSLESLIDLDGRGNRVSILFDNLSTFENYHRRAVTIEPIGMTHKINLPTALGDLTKTYYVGKKLVVEFGNSVYREYLITGSRYISGSTVITVDKPAFFENAVALFTDKTSMTTGNNRIEYQYGMHYLSGGRESEKNHQVFNPSKESAVLISNGVGEVGEFFKVQRDGDLKSYLDHDGLLMVTALLISGVNVKLDTRPTPETSGSDGDIIIDNSRSSKWLGYKKTNAGWKPFGQVYSMPESPSTTVKPTGLGVDDAGYFWFANGKPIWWSGEHWLDATGGIV